MELNKYFTGNPRIALAFSGGVDSSYLLYEGINMGADMRPYYVKTAFQPQFELDDAKRLAEELGVKLNIIEHDILSAPNVRENPENRCYYCKKSIFELIQKKALADGCTLLADGTNFSDEVNDRPGMRALKELAVCSPLRECGLTKDEIRRKSREAGLFTWNKPSYACLATRIPAGMEIVEDDLKRIESAESKLAGMGFTDFRMRLFGSAARLQVTEEQIDMVMENREQILNILQPYFENVFLDLKSRQKST